MQTFHQRTKYNYFLFQKGFGDFYYKTNAQGLDLSKLDSRGTETAKYANFSHFSHVFKRFASETHKTHSWDIFTYFDAFLSIFVCFAVYIRPKMMSV